MKAVLALVIGSTITAALAGCGKDPCSEFSRRIRDPGSVQRLEQWVDQRAAAGQLQPKSKLRGRIRHPGNYVLVVDFDPKTIGLGNQAEARAITEANGDVSAVFFGERNFQGIVVKVGSKPTFAIPNDILIPVTSRTSLVCQRRD